VWCSGASDEGVEDTAGSRRARGQGESMACAMGLPPLSVVPERFTAAWRPGSASAAACSFGGLPARAISLQGGDVAGFGDACQSFCLSVQLAAISPHAPSAAFACEGSLLTLEIVSPDFLLV